MKNFTFAMKWHEILKSYSNDIRREVYDAIIEYVATGTIIEMQPVSRMAFDFIRYEIDEKARRKEARLAKKQNNTSETQHSPSQEFDSDQLAEEYIDSGKATTSLVVRNKDVAIVVDKDRIRGFVKQCVQDMLDRRLTPQDDKSRFFSTLHLIVSNRLEIIRKNIKSRNPSEPFTNEIWQMMMLDARRRFPENDRLTA